MNRSRACFIGGARYSNPLDPTSRKKFRALGTIVDLFVIGFSSDLRPRRFAEAARFYLMPNLPVPLLRYLEVFLLGTLIACWLVARHKVRVLIAQSPYEGLAAAVAKLIAGWSGYEVRLVVENHGDFEESIFLQRGIAFPRVYRFFMRRFARFSLKHADVLRAISTSTSQQLERWIPGKPIVQFPTWTDLDVFLTAGARTTKIRSRKIVYAGVLIPRKGVHHLLNAFSAAAADFSDARLVIVGREDNKDYAAELKRQVKRLVLEDRVEFVQPMPQAELASYMSRACVFVLPSVSEALGRVVLEAMATGTPVIGSDVGGIPDMVEDGVTGFLVPPGDETKLAEKILRVLARPDEADKMGVAARAFAAGFFSTDSYVAGYRRLLELAETFLIEDGEHAPSAV